MLTRTGSSRKWRWFGVVAVHSGLLMAVMAGLVAHPARAQAQPEQSGLRFNRLGAKAADTLARKAGGPTERIEITSTDDNRDFVVKVYTLNNGNASEVFELIQQAVALEGGLVTRIAPGSVCIADEKTHECRIEYTGKSQLVVTVPEWMIPYLDQSIEALDRQGIEASALGTGGLYTRVRHRLASEVADLIAETAASPFVILIPDDARQLLYIEDTPSYFEGDLEALRVFDTAPAQIETRVRIYEIDEDNSKDVGLDWYAWKKSISGGGLTAIWDGGSNYDLDLQSLSATLSFNPLLATEFLNYMVAHGHAEVITDTRLTQIHQATATIESTTDIPFVIRGFLNGRVADSPLRDSPVAVHEESEATATGEGESETFTVSSIREFVEGIVVEMTPRIAEEVELQVKASVTSHVGFTPHQSVPILSASRVDSTVLLKPGEAAVIGGLSRQTKINARTGIPLLKEVPVLKYLVSREVERRDKSQIIITIELEEVIAGAPARVPTKEALPQAP